MDLREELPEEFVCDLSPDAPLLVEGEELLFKPLRDLWPCEPNPSEAISRLGLEDHAEDVLLLRLVIFTLRSRLLAFRRRLLLDFLEFSAPEFLKFVIAHEGHLNGS